MCMIFFGRNVADKELNGAPSKTERNSKLQPENQVMSWSLFTWKIVPQCQRENIFNGEDKDSLFKEHKTSSNWAALVENKRLNAKIGD